MMAVLKNGSNIAKMKMSFYVISELLRDTLVVFPMSPELMKYTTCSIRLENVPLSQRKSIGFSVFFGEWNNTRRTKLVKLFF